MSDPQPGTREVLARIRARLATLPRGRMVNTREWNAVAVADALRCVDAVAAEFGIPREDA